MNNLKTSMLIAFLGLTSTAVAQNKGMITGMVTGKNASAAEGATVSLLRAKDSSLIKLTAAGKDGKFSFDMIADGKFIISAVAVGQQINYSGTIELSPQQQTVQLPAIILSPLIKELAGVSVAAKRPLIEQRIDRTIVNVDASITNIGTSALEILEKSPGISVDREGNISLKGKEGVTVMIDGRPTQLGGADLANLLRNISSNQLDLIEIMANPPARYDAAGTSGVINIKIKKTTTAGYNGSASVTYTQGRYPKVNEGFNFNYRDGKVNVFSNLSHNYQKSFGLIKIDRNILNNSNSIDNFFNQQAGRIIEGNTYSAKAGIDFFATNKTTIGFVLNGNARKMSAVNDNSTRISNANKELESITYASVENESDWKSLSANLNFRTVLDKKGKEITSDVDFQNYRTHNQQFMVNSYADANGNAYRKADTLLGDLPQNIDVYTARIDFVHPIKKDMKFEAGLKTGLVKTDNNARYDSIQYGAIVYDLNRSNHFIYEENINAAYLNLSKPLTKKLSAQFGLRLENTNARGRQITTGENFERHYTQLFPTAYFQYKINDKHNFAVNFGRRVRRPNYQSLNPFIRFIDRYTYSQGNPNLKPSISHSIEVSHTWKNQITTALNYSKVTDMIEGVIEQKGQEAYTMPFNLASLVQFSLSINANTPVTKWWTSTLNFLAFNNRYKGAVTSGDINLAATSFVLTGTQQFEMTKTITVELNGRVRSGWYEGVMKAKPIAYLSAGISKQVLKNQGTIRLSVRDIFYSQRFRGKTQYGNVDFAFQEVNESRVASLGFFYKFSKGKKISPVKRTAGSANEEAERAGN